MIWTTGDPLASWARVELDELTADLFDVDIGVWGVDEAATIIVGADGTLILGRDDEWTKLDVDVADDLLAHTEAGVLSATGELFEFDGRALTLRETIPGARAFERNGLGNVTSVGAGGSATAPPRWDEVACQAR